MALSLRRAFPELRQMMRWLDEPLMSTHRFPSIFGSSLLHQPNVDFRETKKNYVIEAELPGAKKEDIQIECMDHRTLVIQGRIGGARHSGEEGEGEAMASGDQGGEQQKIDHPSKLNIDESDGVVPTNAEKAERNQASKLMRQSMTGEVQHKGEEGNDGGVPSTLWHSERFTGVFHRSFTFPEPFDPQKIQASYKQGLLSILVPKAERKGIRVNIDVDKE
jgi:HSP20 family molecular chaperone IbpA